MTPLRFRAWHKQGRRMAFVSQIDLTTNTVEVWNKTTKTPWDRTKWENENSIIIMQSTGLSDKKGKEIFEGDIVEIKNTETFKLWGDTDEPQVVKWDGCCFSTRNIVGDASLFHHCNQDNYEVEIIGNIYQNSDLLSPL